MVPSITLGTPVRQISLPSHPWALDLSESTSLGIQLFCVRVMEQSQLVGLKPFTWMKQNWNPAFDIFLIQVTRPPRTCWTAVFFQYTDTPGLLGHAFRKTLRRLSEALEEGPLSQTQNSPGNLSALGL